MAARSANETAPPAHPPVQPLVRFEGVTKRFGDFIAVNNVDLDIQAGEFFALLGASGCGKTTLLRMLAGFETPTAGRILIDGVDVSRTPPYERPVNMMFQSYALFPHMSVEQNIAFGLVQDGLSRTAIRSRVQAMLDLIQMTPFAKRKPAQLSGGQRQRVALARSLAKSPKVLLLDEPLAALDKKLRERTQLELVNIQEQVGVTFVMVTHDQEEAMTMSNRIGVMNAGVIQQVGTPVDIYEYPTSVFVADFIGTANMFEGTVEWVESARMVIGVAGFQRPLVVTNSSALPVGASTVVMVRPEKLRVYTTPPADLPNWLEGTVSDIAYLGDISIYHVALATGHKLQVTQTNLHHADGAKLTWGDSVVVGWHPADCLALMP